MTVMLVLLPLIISRNPNIEVVIVLLLIILLIDWFIFGIAISLTLAPYITTSIAVFYREISEGRYSKPHVETEAEEFSYEAVWEKVPEVPTE